MPIYTKPINGSFKASFVGKLQTQRGEEATRSGLDFLGRTNPVTQSPQVQTA